MPYFHQVARLRPRNLSLIEPALAPRVWTALRRAFPLALLALLMPTHAHLIGAGRDPDETRVCMARALGCAIRGLGKYTWEPLPPPEIMRDRTQLRRNLRYVAINPCKWGLVPDPLAWLWSSYRDLFGAITGPWIGPDRLAAALGNPDPDFPERWHRYVSSDRSVSESGTPAPNPIVFPLGELPVHGLQDILDSCAAAVRLPPDVALRRPDTRRLFVSLAQQSGWTDNAAIARFAGLSRRTVERARGTAPSPFLHAALACLADPRFRTRPALGRPSRGNPFVLARKGLARPLWD